MSWGTMRNTKVGFAALWDVCASPVASWARASSVIRRRNFSHSEGYFMDAALLLPPRPHKDAIPMGREGRTPVGPSELPQECRGHALGRWGWRKSEWGGCRRIPTTRGRSKTGGEKRKPSTLPGAALPSSGGDGSAGVFRVSSSLAWPTYPWPSDFQVTQFASYLSVHDQTTLAKQA